MQDEKLVLHPCKPFLVEMYIDAAFALHAMHDEKLVLHPCKSFLVEMYIDAEFALHLDFK